PALTFSRDGSLLVSGGDRVAAVWDVKAGKLLRSFSTLAGINSVALSSEGILAAATDARDESVRLWSLKTGEPLSWVGMPGQETTFVAITSNGRQLVTTGSSAPLNTWDVDTQGFFAASGEQTARGSVFACSDDGRLLISASRFNEDA